MRSRTKYELHLGDYITVLAATGNITALSEGILKKYISIKMSKVDITQLVLSI